MSSTDKKREEEKRKAEEKRREMVDKKFKIMQKYPQETIDYLSGKDKKH